MRAARRVARQVQRHMNKLDRTVRIRNYKVCNVMASCRMPFGINIEEMARRYPQAEYEPELYIGLKWKFTDPKAVLRIHTTGSIGVTGGMSRVIVTCLLSVGHTSRACTDGPFSHLGGRRAKSNRAHFADRSPVQERRALPWRRSGRGRVVRRRAERRTSQTCAEACEEAAGQPSGGGFQREQASALPGKGGSCRC